MSFRNQRRPRRGRREFQPRVEGGVAGLEARVVLTTFAERGFVDTAVVSNLVQPTSMALAPDGRIFVTQKDGNLRVIKDGRLLETPFATVPVDDRVERGLGGVVLDPDFAHNHHVYLYYTVPSSPFSHNRLSRFTAQGDVAAPGSEKVLLDLDPIEGAGFHHNGGAMRFGPDGKLYLAVGDGNDRPKVQSLESLAGKLLRLNPDGSIPTDNPFYHQTEGSRRAIWALGLRNPFTMDIQPGTGRIYINDVGQEKYEEINAAAAGANFGWPLHEGKANAPGYTDPVYVYNHPELGGDVTGSAITGGAFYNPATPKFPSSYVGDYFFSDLVGRWIKVLDPATRTIRPFADDLPEMVVNLAADGQGSLYYLTISLNGYNFGSQVRRIQYAPDSPPLLSPTPPTTTVVVGQPATFTIDADGGRPLTYQWQRDGEDIPEATGTSYTLPSATLDDTGATFRVVVTNEFGTVTSPETELTVLNDQAPNPVILTPTFSTTWQPGDTIAFSGYATDLKDGELPASSLTWWVELHHNEHEHPVYPPTSGIRQGSFEVPGGHLGEGLLWLRIHLEATDSAGLSTEVTRDIYLSPPPPPSPPPAPQPGVVLGGLFPGRTTLNPTTTTTTRPRLGGKAPANSRIVLFAIRETDNRVFAMGSTQATRAGKWQLTSRPLPFGSYRVLASARLSTPRGVLPKPADPPKPIWSWSSGPLVVRAPLPRPSSRNSPGTRS